MRLRSVALVATMVLGACSSAPTGTPSPDVAIGKYVLVQVDNKNLPVTRSATTVITDGTLFLSSDGTYSSGVHQAVTTNGTTTITTIGLQSGTWSRVNEHTVRLVPFAGADVGVDAVTYLPDLYYQYNNTTYGYRKG